MNKQDFLKVQTCVLRVNIHCDGCKVKVKKTLLKVDGVFSVLINSEQNKVTVSGNADPATLVKKLTKSGKHAELWGGGGHKGSPNMMQMSAKDANKNQKGDGRGGKDQLKGGLPEGFKDLKAPSKDQKSVEFNLHDDHGDDDEDDYSDEDYTDEDGEDDFDHKHPPPKMMPFMGGKGQFQGYGINGLNMMMMNEKMAMMMLNEKKNGGAGGSGGNGGGKGKKDEEKHSHTDDNFDFDMPTKMKGHGHDGKGGKDVNKA